MQIKNYTDAAKLLFAVVSILALQANVLMASDTLAGANNRARQINVYSNYESPEAGDVLWLARILYSESKVREEQIIVAWVVRNRVESGYRGAESYKDVALSPAQFSGLWPGDSQYKLNISRNYKTKGDKAWDQAMAIAQAVYLAPETLRPIAETVRHFYSPIAVTRDPHWVSGMKPSLVLRNDEGAVRFAFYDGVR